MCHPGGVSHGSVFMLLAGKQLFLYAIEVIADCKGGGKCFLPYV